MKRALLLTIRLYQRLVSPLLLPACRYVPTCSQYAHDAVELHGSAKGAMLAAWRLLRCHPLARGGYDPVPPDQTLDDPAFMRLARLNDATHASRRDAMKIARHFRVCLRTQFRGQQWSKWTENPAAERRNSLAQRGSAGGSGTKLSSASGAAQFSHTLFSAGLLAQPGPESRRDD
jgi:putative membrane protein insertion efficiency factor